MIAKAKAVTHDSVPAWHKDFLTMLPTIRRYASIAFSDLKPEARDEAVAEVVANAMVSYHRLVELNKSDLAYPSVLARFGVAQTKTGRKVGGHLNGKDVLSSYAQRKNGITVERLERFNQRLGVWKEILVEDKTATPADIAASRIDFADWLKTLTDRQRKIAGVLINGESTKATAREFGLTAGRVSQVRRELKQCWDLFVGDKALSGTTCA